MPDRCGGAGPAGHIACDPVDETRRHPAEPDQPWYSGAGSYPTTDWQSPPDRDGGYADRDEPFRVPEPRSGRSPEHPFGARPQPDLSGGAERYADLPAEPRRGRAAQDPLDGPLPPVETLRGPVDPLGGDEVRPAARGPLGAGLPPSLASVAGEGGPGYGEGTPSARGYLATDPVTAPGPGDGAGGYPAADPRRPLDAPTSQVPRLPGPARDDDAFPAPGSRHHSQPIDRASLRRPAGPTEPVGDGVYRTRRPAVALVLAAIAVLLELVALRVLVDAVVGGPVSVSGAVAGTFLALGLPPFALGCYAVVTTGRAVDPRSLLRPPVGYLVIGLVLFLAAGLAAG